jgi:hypothetical protein
MRINLFTPPTARGGAKKAKKETEREGGKEARGERSYNDVATIPLVHKPTDLFSPKYLRFIDEE